MPGEPIVAVVGMARSGTSLTMSMLDAGGVPIYCEPDNYGSSFETEKILGLPHDYAWLDECEGKAVKILEPLEFRPPKRSFRFIWTKRIYKYQAKSHGKILGVEWNRDTRRLLAKKLRKDTHHAIRMLGSWPDSKLLQVHFEQLLANPEAVAAEIAGFLGLDPDRIPDMAARVVPRTHKCYPGMLELQTGASGCATPEA